MLMLDKVVIHLFAHQLKLIYNEISAQQIVL